MRPSTVSSSPRPTPQAVLAKSPNPSTDTTTAVSKRETPSTRRAEDAQWSGLGRRMITRGPGRRLAGPDGGVALAGELLVERGERAGDAVPAQRLGHECASRRAHRPQGSGIAVGGFS